MKLPVDYDALTTTARREVRKEYIRQQNGKCFFCKGLLDGPPIERVAKVKVNSKLFPVGFFNNRIHLHHDHKTGKTIGAVHAHCNAVLWQHHGV